LGRSGEPNSGIHVAPDGEPAESCHVENAGVDQRGAEQFRALGDCRADEQAALRHAP
jgi:hypothetical protein